MATSVTKIFITRISVSQTRIKPRSFRLYPTINYFHFCRSENPKKVSEKFYRTKTELNSMTIDLYSEFNSKAAITPH